MSDTHAQMRALLVRYIRAIAERNGFGPGENFEYKLWDTLHGRFEDTDDVTLDEGQEIVWLAVETDCWVTYNHETGRFELIDMDAWEDLLSKRGH
jgi:hypothetical protein